MPTIFLPEEERKITAIKGVTLLDCLRGEGFHVDAPCNGIKICRKCAVIVDGNPVLSCDYIVEEDVEVVLVSGGKLESDGTPGQHHGLEHGALSFDFMKSESHYNDGFIDTLTDKPRSVLGVGVDAGTTVLSVCLYDLLNDEFLGISSRFNPQTRFGADVLSRICYSRDNEGGLEMLRDLVYSEISSMIEELLETHGAVKDDIYCVAVAGNTIMLHFFAGISAETISLYPYDPVFTDSMDLFALPLPMNPKGVVTLLPSISGYIGGDITAGLMAIGFLESAATALFIDVGTNGEMVLASKGRFFATSTAAGPALEGMNIDCGSRAVPGAIGRAYIKDGEIGFDVIGGGSPNGICGSGLIDLTACLLELGYIGNNGKLDASRHDVKDNKVFFTEKVFISQKDIRQIQLAKGAIAAGIELLLKCSETEYAELERIYIAGSFGYNLDYSNVKKIGMVDKECICPVSFVGNTSLAGATMLLCNRKLLSDMENMKEIIEVVELGEMPDFRDVFLDTLSF